MTARLRGSCMQLGRLAGKGGDPPPVAGNHRLLGREPGSAHAADVGKGKKVGRGCGRDATGGAKNHVRERPAERLEHAYPPRLLGREKLKRRETRGTRGDHVRGCHHSRKQRQATRPCRLDKRWREPRAYAKAGAGSERLLEVICFGDCSDTHDRPFDLTRHRPDGLERRRSSQGDFEHPHATRDQGLGQWHRVRQFIYDNDRDHRTDAHHVPYVHTFSSSSTTESSSAKRKRSCIGAAWRDHAVPPVSGATNVIAPCSAPSALARKPANNSRPNP